MHLKLAKVAQTLLKSLKGDNDTPVMVQFYKRKLRTFNFCVHNVKSSTSSMFYGMRVTKCGLFEDCDCLIHYINNSISPDVNKLITVGDKN